MNRKILRPLLVILFFLLIFSPLFLLPFVGSELSRGWQTEFAIILGFIGLTMAGWQIAPVSRFTPAQKLFNLDKLYNFHHLLSLFSALFVLLHYLLLLLNFQSGIGINKWALAFLNIFTSPLRAKFAVLALLGYFLITITSVFRKQLRLNYDVWRGLHDVFTVIIVGAGLTHVLLVGNYSAAPAMKALLWFETAIWILVALYIRVIKPLQQLRHPYKITAVQNEGQNTYTLALAPQGFDLPVFHPGQIAWLTVRRSPFSLIRNPFSISSSTANKDNLEFAIKDLGDFTSTVKVFQIGETAYVDGPFGFHDMTRPEHKSIVLIAGGIGISPAMSVLRSMADAGDPRTVTLLYGNRTLEDLPFGGELNRLEKTLPAFKKVLVPEKPSEEWQGYRGFITTDLLRKELLGDPQNMHYFICGPLPMMAAMRKCLAELNVPQKNIHLEEFNMA
jgi:predicted ferric reductase